MTTKEFKQINSPHSQSKRIHELFEKHCNSENIQWESEFKFHPKRKWRFDYAIENKSDRLIAVEIDGGLFLPKGRHSGGVGQLKDNEKHNEAALLGWRILRFTPNQVRKGEAIKFIKRLFE